MASRCLRDLHVPSMPVATEWCPICSKATMCDIETRHGVKPIRTLCDCEMDALNRREAKANNREFERMMDAAASACFVTPNGRGSFAKDDGRNDSISRRCRKYAEGLSKASENGLVLYGEPRCGKTFLAEAVASLALEKGLRAVMRTAAQIVDTYHNASVRAHDELLALLAKCDLLVIDDLGSERDTEFAREVMLSTIDGAYSAHKPLIVTTNCDPDEISTSEDVHNRRLWGRIMERCEKIKV